MTIKNDLKELGEFLHSEYSSFTDLDAFEDRRKEILDNHWWTIHDSLTELVAINGDLRVQLEEMAEYKMAVNQLIGIPASVGIPEPIEGFAKRPQDIMHAVRDMALKIESLLQDRQL